MLSMNKAIRKIAAFGAGATMLGATVLGAMATDLSTYPSPFVKDGKYNALIVFGDNAAASDVAGAVDLATHLQYNMKTAASGGGTTTTLSEGALIGTSSTFYRFGDYASDIKQTITSADLPDMLAQTTFVDVSGTEFKVKPQIKTPATVIRFDKTIPDATEPLLFMDFETNATNMGSFRTEIDFPTAVNLSQAGGKTLTLFGKDYVIGEASGEVACSGTAKVTLYAAAVDKTFTAGETSTVDVAGTEVTVEVVGVNTQTTIATATITVNGESKSVTSSMTYIIGGQRVYVKDVFAYTAPTTSGAVRLFLGSNKIVLEHGQTVATGTGGTSVYGTIVDITASSNKCAKIGINMTPYSMDPQVDALKVGGSIVDPVFGAYKLSFAGAVPLLDDASRDVIKLYPSSEDKFRLEFTSKNAMKYALDIFKGNTANNEVLLQSADYRIVNENSKQIQVNDYFVIKDDNDYSHILRLTAVRNSTTAQEIRVQDIAEGGTTSTWSYSGGTGTMTYDGKSHTFVVTSWGASSGNVSMSDGASQFLYTQSGAKITLPIPIAAANQSVGAGNTVVNITEETSYNTEGAATDYGLLVFALNYTTGLSGNDFYQSTPDYTKTAGMADWDGFDLVGNSGYNYQAVTPYGTFVKWNSDQNSYRAEVNYAGDQTKFNVYVAPTSATSTTTSTSGNVQITQIQVGAAKLASEALAADADLSKNNYILVGGPCANPAAAKAMGSPADCLAGFEEGKAKIKLYDTGSGKVAMLVAGMTATDTRRASKAIALDKLKSVAVGTTEVEVITTSDTPTINVVTS